MSFRIEYFRDDIKVGADPCLKPLDDAFKDALIGLGIHNADRARILDMNQKGKQVGVMKR
jgi:hypothetical protein